MQAAESLVEQVIKQCREGRFTGLLRVRAKEGDGELRFLSGIRDDVRFGVSTGDEALERLMRATNPKFEAVARLPGLTGGFKQRLPHEGVLGEIRPIDLFRYCETYALTCTLELNSRGRQARAIYQVGDLTSLDTDQAGEDAVAAMLDATEGTYRFELPPLELPEGISVHLSQPPPGAEPISTDFGAGAPTSSARPPSTPAPSDEPAVFRAEQELKRKAAEVAEAKKRSATPIGMPAAKAGETDADLVRKLEEESRRKAQAEEEARRRREEEERRKAQAAEEARRRAEADAQRKAEEAQRKAEEARRRAEEEARRKAQAEAEEAKRRAQAEEARRKAEAEAARRAEEEAEARRKAEAEAARRAEEEAEAHRLAEAEAARRVEEEAEARRKAEAEAEAATRRKVEAERAAASAKASAVTEKRKAKDAPGARAEGAKLAAREDEEPEFARKGGSAGKVMLLLLVVAAVVAFLLMNR